MDTADNQTDITEFTEDHTYQRDNSGIHDMLSAVGEKRDDYIPDSDFYYLGMESWQVQILKNQSNDMRRLVYEELLRNLMETGPGYGQETEAVDF